MSVRLAVFTGLWSLNSLWVAAADEVARYEFSEPHMGAEFVLRLYATSQEEAERAAKATFTRIAELDARLSDYKSESELSRLSRSSGSGVAIRVSDDMWNVLSAAKHFSEASGGAFDVSVGPYVRLWRRARRTGQLPSEDRLAQARSAVGYRFIEMDDDEQTVRLTRANMRLDLGAIAKGYAADEALEVLRSHGITQALVDAGGDLAIGEPPPGELGWRIAIAPLRSSATPSPPPPGRGRGLGGGGEAGQSRQESSDEEQESGESKKSAAPTILLLSNCGIATSGDAYQFVEFEGRRYSHIVDPRSGMGVVGASSVTVIAPDGTTADALASAVSVLGHEKGIAMIDRQRSAAAMVAVLEDGKERRFLSARMHELRRE